MIKTNGFIKKISRRTDFSGMSFFARGYHFDWKSLMTLFLLMMIVAISFSVHVFLGEQAGDIFQSAAKAPNHDVSINEKTLDQVIANYAIRANNLKDLQTNRPVFVDPSL